jgi:RNA polymerase sigma factor (sigma-70 family)
MTPIVSTTLLRTQSDARLVELAREGHERAFEAIVERYRRPLHRYIRRMLPSARVEDVLQTSFMNAWTSLRDGAEVRDLRPWLYRITHNAAVNTLKRAGYDFEELSESLSGGETTEGDAERRAVMRETLASLAALPERQRRALLETAIEGRNPYDVAREMGMSDGAFRQLVFRARATMRAAATAVTPMPVVLWAAGMNAGAGGDVTATRIAELAGGAGGAGIAATVGKTGVAVVAAGALVAGGTGVVVHDRDAGGQDQTAAFAASPTAAAQRGREPEPGDDRGGATELGDDNRGSTSSSNGRRSGGDDGDRRGRGRGGDDGGDDNSGRGSGSSGSGDDGSGDDSSGSGSGSGSSGSGRSGSSDDTADDDSRSSGSGSSGSGSSGSGSSGSGSSDDVTETSRSSDDGSSRGGSSGSGSSGSGSSGSGSSGSGSSGSGSSGSGDESDDD